MIYNLRNAGTNPRLVVTENKLLVVIQPGEEVEVDLPYSMATALCRRDGSLIVSAPKGTEQ